MSMQSDKITQLHQPGDRAVVVMWHLLLFFTQNLSRSEHFFRAMTPVHTSSVCRLTVRQADRRTALQAWEGQMFPYRHGREMFATPGLCLPGSPQSHRLAARCPRASLCWGKRAGGGRRAHIYTGDEEETTNVLCQVARGKGNKISHRPVRWRKISFYSWAGQ